MKNAWTRLIVLVLTLFATACSYQYRDSDPGVSAEQALALLEEVAFQGQGKGFYFMDPMQLKLDPYSTVYFAESSPSMGAVASIFSIADASFLGTLWQSPIAIGTTVFDLDLSYVGMVFLDAQIGSDRYFTLLIKFETPQVPGQPDYFIAQSAPNDYVMTETEFMTRMQLPSGLDLVLRSTDLDEFEGQLAPTIQLKVSVVENGIEYDVGQFSVLHGFGGIE